MSAIHDFLSQADRSGSPLRCFRYLPSELWLVDGPYAERSWLGIYACVVGPHDYRIHALEQSGLFILSCDELFVGARVVITDAELNRFLADYNFPISE